jgi:hypothetical protein
LRRLQVDLPPFWCSPRTMNRFPHISAVLFTLAILAIALVGSAGHKPVCCKGYAYWDILEPHSGGKRWRSVKTPVTFRQVPITPSIWNLSEAAQRALLVMMAKAQREAGELKIKTRSWDAVCWHYGETEPVRHSWPVQP